MTAAQLEELEHLGELQFNVVECAIILKIEINEFRKLFDSDDIVKMAYERGRLKASAAVRQAILQQAKQGSSPAQKQMMELISSHEPKSGGKEKGNPHHI